MKLLQFPLLICGQGEPVMATGWSRPGNHLRRFSTAGLTIVYFRPSAIIGRPLLGAWPSNQLRASLSKLLAVVMPGPMAHLAVTE
jgi:hypothetical protein